MTAVSLAVALAFGQPRQVPQEAVELIKRFEGFCATPYLCPAGVPSIGYGSTRGEDGARITMGHPPINYETAERWLKRDMADALRDTLKLCPNLAEESEARLAAIISFTYNLGAGRLKISTLRRRVCASDWEGAAREIRKWILGGGKKLAGLVARREAEAALLLQDTALL